MLRLWTAEPPARRQVNAERRVTPERDAAEGILFDVFEGGGGEPRACRARTSEAR